jgi:DNA repair protein RadC
LLADLLAPLGRECAAAADDLIREYGGLAQAVVHHPRDPSRCRADPRIADLFRAVHAVMTAMLKDGLRDGPLLASAQAVADYLVVAQGHEDVECLRVLFLDVKQRLIRDEVMFRGSVSETAAHPREIVKRALQLGATGLILVHNHPSGDRSPSRADRIATRDMAAAGRLLDIAVHDHLIVTRSGIGSMRAEGLL